jgi:hypothetical protein
MIEQFDDETMARLLKDQPEPKRWKDMTTEEQAAVTARKRERELEVQRQTMRQEIEKIWRLKVPERYQSVRLKSLTPSPKSHMPEDKQKVIIGSMQKAPAAGYAFLSPQGWSKSTFLYALYRRALVDNAWDVAMNPIASRGLHPVAFYEAKELMDRIQQWKIGEADAPMVTAKKIERLKVDHGITTHLFLDEFEKVKKSEFRMAEMYDIINACYKHNAQLVIAGNMTKADLDDKNQYLEGTFRRIEDLTSPHFWEFGGK